MKNYEEMTGSELVALYNERTGENVKRFSTKAVAIRKLKELDELKAQEPAPTCEQCGSDLIETLEGKLVCWGCNDQPNEPETLTYESHKVSNGPRIDTLLYGLPASPRKDNNGWARPEVREMRSKRYGVLVNGDYYDSVAKAFDALGLPMHKHIKFRGELRDAKSMEAFGYEWVICERRTKKQEKQS